jgi:hypothetical protein
MRRGVDHGARPPRPGRYDTKLRVDSPRLGVGTKFDLEGDLDLDESGEIGRFTAAYRIGRRHQFRIGYYDWSRSASEAVRTIRWTYTNESQGRACGRGWSSPVSISSGGRPATQHSASALVRFSEPVTSAPTSRGVLHDDAALQ